MAVFATAVAAPSAGAAVLTQYSFEGNLLDTAAGGATADHMTAAANNGVLSTVYVPGVPGLGGQAVQVGLAPGDASVLTAPDSNDLDLATASWTMEAFVQRTANLNQEWERFATKWFGPPGSGLQYHWAFRDQAAGVAPKSQDVFTNGGQRINQSATPDVPEGQWMHVALTNDNVNGLRAWQDGLVVGSAAYQTIIAGSFGLKIGNGPVTGNEALQFHGWVDEFLIHDVSQDSAYMAGRAALLVPEPSAFLLFGVGGLGLMLRRRR